MVQIKICGITNLADALDAVEAGANALGFNFYRPSPRFVEPEVVRSIVRQLPSNVLTVGVFVNESEPETVARLADHADVSGLQLHGDETPEYCHALKGRFVIKALRVGDGYDPKQAARYPADAILLDAFDPFARGGTGQTCDWTLARQTRELVPKLFLAGGLSAENVAEAISAVGPYAVDASSRLEIAPGRKDIKSVRAFVAAVQLASVVK